MTRFNCHWARMEDSGIPIGDSFLVFSSPEPQAHKVSL